MITIQSRGFTAGAAAPVLHHRAIVQLLQRLERPFKEYVNLIMM